MPRRRVETPFTVDRMSQSLLILGGVVCTSTTREKIKKIVSNLNFLFLIFRNPRYHDLFAVAHGSCKLEFRNNPYCILSIIQEIHKNSIVIHFKAGWEVLGHPFSLFTLILQNMACQPSLALLINPHWPSENHAEHPSPFSES